MCQLLSRKFKKIKMKLRKASPAYAELAVIELINNISSSLPE